MATPQLGIYKREIVGKNSVAKERRKGNIPAIIYSRGKETKLVFIKEREIEKILAQYGGSTRLALEDEGERSYAVIKEIQRENLKSKLLHVDLQTLDDHQKIKLTLPIHVINREAVESNSEFLQIQHKEIEIQTYPKYIPNKIEVDAKLLKKKDSLTVADLNIGNNENIELFLDRNTTIATLAYGGRLEETSKI